MLADLRRKGLIRHIGVSNATAAQVAEAQAITDVVCVQNNYNLAHRRDDALIDDLARQGIAYVPFFPLGGFTPLQSSTLSSVATRLGATPMQVALAWLLHRSPNILLIPGTSSVAHLRENLAAAQLTLSPQTLAELDGIAAAARSTEHGSARHRLRRSDAPADTPLTRDRILATAEDVIRRFGPAKATVVDVARALGVSHAAVYRHVATKAELRDLVVGRWVEATMPPLRAIAALPGPAPQRLRRLFDTLIAVKRRRAADDPELFAAYRTLAADAQSVVVAHVDELIGLAAMIIRSGVKDGTFRTVDPVAAARAVLVATSRFHHPAHAAEWGDPAIDAAYNDVWRLLMDGLRMAKGPGRAARPQV